MPMICCIEASGKWQVAIQLYGNLAIWQPGDTLCQSEWRKIKADKLCNCSRRQVNLPRSPCLLPSLCVLLILAASGRATFVASLSAPAPLLSAVPRYVCIIFIPRMPWQRLYCMWHSPARVQPSGRWGWGLPPLNGPTHIGNSSN